MEANDNELQTALVSKLEEYGKLILFTFNI